MITLDKNENVIMEIRKHWIILLFEIAFSIILIFLPIFIYPVLQGAGLEITVTSMSFLIFLYTIWVFILWLGIFVFWTNYYLDVWIVTNQKIFDCEQIALFKREVSILHFEKIQDVTYEITGLIQSLINVGNVTIQTAGAHRNFVIKGVYNPSNVQKKINEVLKTKTNLPHAPEPL